MAQNGRSWQSTCTDCLKHMTKGCLFAGLSPGMNDSIAAICRGFVPADGGKADEPGALLTLEHSDKPSANAQSH